MNSRNGAVKSNETKFMVFNYFMHVLTIIIITSRMCGHVGGHAYSVSVSKWLLDWQHSPNVATHPWDWQSS